MTPDELLTPIEAAKALRFSTARPVYKLIHTGELPASRIGGRLLISPAAVQELLDASSQDHTQQDGGLRALERN